MVSNNEQEWCCPNHEPFELGEPNDNSSGTPGTTDQSAGSPGPSGPDSSPGSADSVTELPPQGPQFIKEK